MKNVHASGIKGPPETDHDTLTLSKNHGAALCVIHLLYMCHYRFAESMIYGHNVRIRNKMDALLYTPFAFAHDFFENLVVLLEMMASILGPNYCIPPPYGIDIFCSLNAALTGAILP